MSVGSARQELDIAAGNICRHHAMVSILDAFQEEDVYPIAVKGFALLHTIYGGAVERRPMVDVDLLMESSEIPRAAAALEDLGFHEQVSGQHAFVRKRGWEHTKIELHDDLWYLTDAEQAAFRRRAVSIQVDGRPLRVPACEDHILLIAVHAVLDHGQLRPQWREDLTELLESGMSWETLLARTRCPATRTALAQALRRLDEEGRGAIPPLVLAELNGTPPKFREVLLEEILHRPEIPDVGHILRLLFQPNQTSQFRALFRQVFPGRDFLRRRYDAVGSEIRARWFRPIRTAGRLLRVLGRIVITEPGSVSVGVSR